MLGWFSADPSYIINGQNAMLGWFSTDPSYLKWPRCLYVMLGWLSADPSYLKWPKCLHDMLGLFSADQSYILNGQDVYMSCLDGLVQTHLISEMAKMSTCHAWMV